MPPDKAMCPTQCRDDIMNHVGKRPKTSTMLTVCGTIITIAIAVLTASHVVNSDAIKTAEKHFEDKIGTIQNQAVRIETKVEDLDKSVRTMNGTLIQLKTIIEQQDKNKGESNGP